MKKKSIHTRLHGTVQLARIDEAQVEAVRTLLKRTNKSFFEIAKKGASLVPDHAAYHSVLAGPTKGPKVSLPRGLDGRSRDQGSPKAGEIRQKRGDTLVSTLRREYGGGFAPGIRSDTKLETVRERTGKSLHQLVRDMPKKK